MSAFDTAIDTLYADPNFGVDAVYSPSNGNSVPIRVAVKQPDEIVGFGDTRIHTETSVFEARVSEIPQPRSGDIFTVEGIDYVIQGEPERRDAHRLIWTLDARPA